MVSVQFDKGDSMGSAEDHYLAEEQRREQYHINDYNQKIDQIVQMLPLVVRHLIANPPDSSSIGWYLCGGEMRVAWHIFVREEKVLLFSDGRLAQSSSAGCSYDSPGEEPQWFVPLHIRSLSERSEVCHGAFEGLKSHMPPPSTPTPQRKWWRRG